MGGNLNLDDAHFDRKRGEEVPPHLDLIQSGPFGAIKDRYLGDGSLYDVRFQPSNLFARQLGVSPGSYALPLSGLPYQNSIENNIALSGSAERPAITHS